MEDDSDSTTLKSVKMGADNNPSSTSRLVSLQTRKQALEEKIATKNKELRKLCIQEAELTGVMPAEIPLERGEPIPTFRRRVGTAFEYPQNIINSANNEDETVPALETKIQVQRKIVEAALQLANSSTISKSIRRKNMSHYRQTKQQLEFMEERLENLKIQGHTSSVAQSQQLKQKKKPRPLLEADTISTKSSNPSHNEESNISRSSQSLSQKDSNIETERYIFANKYNVNYKNSNQYLLEGDIHNANIQNYHLTDDSVTSHNKLSPVNYINDRRSNENTPYAYIHSQSNPNLYQQQQQQHHHHQQQQQQQQHMYITNTHTLPHMPQYHQTPAMSHPNMNFPVHAHTLQYPNTRTRCLPDEPPRKYEHYRNGYVHEQPHNPYYSSSSSSSHSLHHLSQPYKYGIETSTYNNSVNSHHILAHQQYETDASSAGLGGHWIKTDGGEMVWCPTMTHDDGSAGTWQTDKRFGSLDRRKGKHIHHKRTSPNLDGTNKQILRPVINSQPDMPRPMTLQSGSIRSSRHDRQLVRTQSLGSVGAHTVDSVWPSDDNSSYDSDGHSINELNASTRKLKQKGWCETSLDGPVLPSSPQHQNQHHQHYPHSHSHQHQHQHPAVITEEIRSPVQLPPLSPQIHIQQQQQQQIQQPPLHSPRTPKPILEIPAESKPSPVVETNIEMYNNNVLSELPKNCTVVQAGQCKPYREVTKPFEMSDFYKYSTKFRNQDKGTTPTTPTASTATTPSTPTTPTKNEHGDSATQTNRDGDEGQEDVYQKGVYQPLQPMKCQPFSPNNNFNRSFASIGSPDYANTSLDTSLALNQSTSNVAEHFSAEMNAWYQNHGHAQTRIEIDSNNSSTSPVSMGRSTATLV